MTQASAVYLPVYDMHCDLLSYLVERPHAEPTGVGEMGATIPYLQKGGVKLQVMAIYSDVREGSTIGAYQQAQRFSRIVQDYSDYLMPVSRRQHLQQLATGGKVGAIVAIENAAGLCEETEPLNRTFERLEAIEQEAGRIAYIGITHHTENRFGGGNFSEAGLKEDGKALLDYLHGRNIAIDLAHTSDSLAEDIFTYTAQQNLQIPILASHSNFRAVWNHKRNLPDEFVQEIIQRKGLIGINFLRAYVDNERPETLLEHFNYGVAQGAEDALCFGADFFYTKDHPDKSRLPFYFPEHEDAGKYPELLLQLSQAGFSMPQLRKFSYENANAFLQRLLPA